MAFSITPRLADDFALFQLADELTDPSTLVGPWSNPKFTPCFLRGDGSSRSLTGRIMRESEVHNTDREYRIRLDLHNYAPEEVKITSENQKVTINAKHEEKQDNHGFVTREMTRVYKLPEDVDMKSVTSTMSSNGILSLKAQKLAIDANTKDTTIPVEFK